MRLTILFILLTQVTFAQDILPIQVPIQQSNGDFLLKAFNGGFQAPQFSELDVNRDGHQDIVVFDKLGDVWSVYVYNDTTALYVYESKPPVIFPASQEWALLRDFNCDGLEDIFSFSQVPASNTFEIYKAFIENDTIKYELFVDALKELDLNDRILNLYVSRVDIPAVEDIDGDGDLDVISSEVGGSYLQYYRNRSVEEGYGCDSLIFELADNCWGRFKEDDASSAVVLSPSPDSCIGTDDKGIVRHSGSTVHVYDINQDGFNDILLGDVSSNNVNVLYNSTAGETAYITSQDPVFPSTDLTLDLDEFVGTYTIDIDKDGFKDLLASPNASFLIDDVENIHYYRYEPVTKEFEYESNTFLVDQSLDVGSWSAPVLFDYNADGLMDLLIGNGGKQIDGVSTTSLHLYENIGTSSSPAYSLKTNDYLGLSDTLSSSLFNGVVKPAVGDVDNDGDIDILLGTKTKRIIYLENTAGPNQAFDYSVLEIDLLGEDIGRELVPTLFDVNEDGWLDLIVGDYDGEIAYLSNTQQTASDLFKLEDETWGDVLIRPLGYTFGHASPSIVQDGNAKYLYVGSFVGDLYVYTIEGDGVSNTFSLEQKLFETQKLGLLSVPHWGDLNTDGVLELLIGNSRGGVQIFDGEGVDFKKPAISQTPDFEIQSVCQGTCQFSTNTPIVSVQLVTLEGKVLSNLPVLDNELLVDGYADGMYLLSVLFEGQTKILEKIVVVN